MSPKQRKVFIIGLDNLDWNILDPQEKCVELIDRFGADADGRRRIAAEGMRRAHEIFNCRKLAGHVVELATEGEYKET